MSFFGQQTNNQQPASGFGGFGSNNNNNNNNPASGRLQIARNQGGRSLSVFV